MGSRGSSSSIQRYENTQRARESMSAMSRAGMRPTTSLEETSRILTDRLGNAQTNKRFRDYSSKEIDKALKTIKDGMKFNNNIIRQNTNAMNDSNSAEMSRQNAFLYLRNQDLARDLKAFTREKNKRKNNGTW